MHVARFVAVVDPPVERLVRTVFAPGLGERLQLDVGRVAVQLDEVLANRLHLGEAQVELARAAQVGQCAIVHLADRHRHPLEAVRAAQRQTLHRQRAPNDLLDGVVREHPAGELIQVRPCRTRIDPVFSAGGNGLDGQTEVDQRALGALGHVIGDARLK